MPNDGRTVSEIRMRLDAARSQHGHDKPDGDGPFPRWTPYQIMLDEAPRDLAYLLDRVEYVEAVESATASREKVLRDACEQIRKRCMQCDQGSIGLEAVGAVAMAIIAELCAGELL